MIEYLEFGSAPWGEDCAQVGSPNYYDLVYKECITYKRQLFRLLKANNIDLESKVSKIALIVKGHGHDFGTYYEVVCKFQGDDDSLWGIALWLESNLPEKWDSISREELEKEAA